MATKDPKNRSLAADTLNRWTQQISELRLSIAADDFFDRLLDIMDNAKHGNRSKELMESCLLAAEQAEELFNQHGIEIFKEWMFALLEYAETWKEDGNPILLLNPLMQAELLTLPDTIEPSELPDPVTKLIAAATLFNDAATDVLDKNGAFVEAMDALRLLAIPLTRPARLLQTAAHLSAGTDKEEMLKSLLEETMRNLNLLAEKNAEVVKGEMDTFLSFLDKELEKPKYKGMTLKELAMQARDKDGNYIKGSLFLQACEAADAEMSKQPAPSKKELARTQGALTTIGDRQVTITDRTYQFALTFHENKAAYLVPLKDDILGHGFINEATGEFDINLITGAEKAPMEEIDLPLLTRFFTAAYKSQIFTDSHTITVYWPSFCREMDINPTKDKANDIFGHIRNYKNLYGVIGGSSCYKVFDVLGFDEEANTLTFASPYMNQILCRISVGKHREVSTKKGELKYKKEAYSFLIHSNIVKERNKTAIEIVNCLIALIFQRGQIPDSKLPKNKHVKFPEKDMYTVSCHLSFETIVSYTPLLNERLASLTDVSNRNKVLKNAFQKAYQLLKEKTDIYEYYINLKIPDIIPTYTRLNDVLLITHEGRNKDYAH